MRTCSPVLVVLALVGSLASQARTADNSATALEGTWHIVRIERDGKEIKPAQGLTAVNTGNRFVVKAGDRVIAAGTFKLDTGKKPNAMDLTYTEGPDKGKTFKGIFELDGDTAKFCRPDSPDQRRPTEFKTAAGGGGLFTVYRREKSKR